MRRANIHAALLAVLVAFPPAVAFTQHPPGVVTAAATVPNAEGWTARAHLTPQLPRRPGVLVPTIEAPEEAPSTVGVERSKVAEVRKKNDGEKRAVTDGDAFLLPVWQRGFWVMPPGGMTRFLWQPPVPVNPDTMLVADPVIGCAAP